MVLLVQAIRIARAQAHAMWVVKCDFRRVETFDDFHALDQRRERRATIERFMHPAARHGEVEVL